MPARLYRVKEKRRRSKLLYRLDFEINIEGVTYKDERTCCSIIVDKAASIQKIKVFGETSERSGTLRSW